MLIEKFVNRKIYNKRVYVAKSKFSIFGINSSQQQKEIYYRRNKYF